MSMQVTFIFKAHLKTTYIDLITVQSNKCTNEQRIVMIPIRHIRTLQHTRVKICFSVWI